jgi:drug/metabolite transporter (DMT)-like permease
MGVVVLALSSALLYGTWKFGLGFYRGRLSPWAVLLFSGTAAAVVYGLRGLTDGRLELGTAELTAGVIGGLLTLTGTYLLLLAYQRGKVAVAGGVASTGTLVPVAFTIATGVAVTVSTALGVVMILAGLVAFYLPHAISRRDTGTADRRGLRESVLLALGAALSWGTGILVLDLGSRGSVTGTLLVQQCVQVVAVLILVMANPRRQLAAMSWRTYPVLAGSGVALGLANVAFYAAAQEGSIGLVAVLAALSPMVTALLTFVFMKERLTRMELAALVVVVFGVCCVMA